MTKKITTLKKAIIISAWPGSGKSYAFQHYQDSFTMLDSDSSLFSWVYDENGVKTNTRNPSFPRNYIDHIKENLDKVDFIFVSSHKAVRQALARNGLRYYMVYPYNTAINKKEWLDRFINRGNDTAFCDMIMDNWDNFIDEMVIDMYPIHICLGTNHEGIEFPKHINKSMLEDIIEIEKEWISTAHDDMDMRSIKNEV